MSVDLDAVLRDINAIRAAHFALPPLTEIPHGRPKSASDCPIACALRSPGHLVLVSPDSYLIDGDEEFALSDRLVDFVTTFDAGKFPELVIA